MGAAALPYFVELAAVAVQVAALPVAPDRAGEWLRSFPTGRSYPPTVFLYMKRDPRTKGRVMESVDVLRQNRVKVASVMLSPRKLKGVLARRIGGGFSNAREAGV